jgi:hypothetical protein
MNGAEQISQRKQYLLLNVRREAICALTWIVGVEEKVRRVRAQMMWCAKCLAAIDEVATY